MRGRRNLRKVCRAQEIEEETHATQEQETCQHAERPVLYFLALIFDVEFFFLGAKSKKKLQGFSDLFKSKSTPVHRMQGWRGSFCFFGTQGERRRHDDMICKRRHEIDRNRGKGLG